eukprot:GHVN01030490.1.p1 GENE.GHVN01030490.1~~GHVN01030490.1.p1  ORF type:complete len:247 (-),score=7.39 GHVN01030490.1:164-904(-)
MQLTRGMKIGSWACVLFLDAFLAMKDVISPVFGGKVSNKVEWNENGNDGQQGFKNSAASCTMNEERGFSVFNDNLNVKYAIEDDCFYDAIEDDCFYDAIEDDCFDDSIEDVAKSNEGLIRRKAKQYMKKKASTIIACRSALLVVADFFHYFMKTSGGFNEAAIVVWKNMILIFDKGSLILIPGIRRAAKLTLSFGMMAVKPTLKFGMMVAKPTLKFGMMAVKLTLRFGMMVVKLTLKLGIRAIGSI